MIEPYRFANGETWGDRPTTPAPGAGTSQPPRGRAPNWLALRARRARMDPDWRTHSEETKRRLLAIDARDAHALARRERERGGRL